MSNTTAGDEWREFVGPGGEAVTIVMLFLPIIFVVVVTLLPKALPTTVSLPLAAIFLWIIRLAYLSSDVINSCAAMIQGMIEVATPLTIICGAIYLFNIMEGTGCMQWMMRELKILSKGHPVAEFMLIAWSFAYLIEGASGFGTPAALAAPMLAQLGHPKFKAVVAVLLTNTVATVFGAVGTPIWYGFGAVTDKYYEDPVEALSEIGFKAACALASLALLVPIGAALYLIPYKVLFPNMLFFTLSVASVMLPVVGISFFSYEFPTIIGGMIGLGITAILTVFRVGLRDFDPSDMGEEWQMLNKRGSHYEANMHHDSIHGEVMDQSTDSMDYQSPKAEQPPLETSLHVSSANAARFSTVAMLSSEELEEARHKTVKSHKHLETIASAHSIFSVHDHELDMEMDMAKQVEEVESKAKFELGERETGWDYAKAFALRTFPITMTIILLILTRIEQVGIKNLLTLTDPHLGVQLGNFMWFQISPNLKMLFKEILTDATVESKYETLYTPGVIPFFVVSFATSLIFWSDMKRMETNPWTEFVRLGSRIKGAAIALLGGLMLVSCIRNGGYGSPAYLIGSILSDWVGEWWILISPFLGALGSFFSGSTEVQYVAALNAGYDPTTILAIQAFGASIGNAICLNNIIAARTVIGLDHIGEGKFLQLTGPIVLGSILVVDGLMYLYFVI